MELTVIKRDGSKQPFDISKIKRVSAAAGLSDKKAKLLATHVETWINSLGRKEISALEIRDKVIAELAQLDSYAANMFTWYEKTKEKHV